MPLDSRYTLAPSLQMYFVDKDSGLPLENGQVYFYKDNDRNIEKDVFEISGVPPNYSYTVLPNPVFLSSVGTFQDGSGNDILPYYYPFDENGNIELYFIKVYDHAGVLQFTREGWPNTTSDTVVSAEDVTNFVPNGQFLLHDNVPASLANGFIVGKISQDSTIIAQGGWSFERGPASTATDFVTFPRYGSYVGNPTGNPRYAVQIQTTIAGSDTRKDLALKFPNVNTFASDTQEYNFYFEGQSTTGSDITNVQIIVRKFFGTGGSPSATTEEVITTVSLLASTVSKYNISILFGTNAGKSIGTNNDDYVQIIVRLPPTGVQTALMTDFALTVGDEVLIAFPQQTQAQQLDASTAGWFPVPDPDGYDLYCPAVLGPSGLLFDHSSIAEIVPLMVNAGSQVGNLLACDGTAYRTADYSALGIPYRRLQQVLFNATYNGPIFGTGINFANAYVTANTSTFMLALNAVASVQTNPSDGAVPTTFTFNVNVNKSGTNPNYRVRSNGGGTVTATSNFTDLPAAGISAGTSGMQVEDYTSPTSAGSFLFESAIQYSFELATLPANTLAAGIGVAGKYFEFSNHATTFRMWFKVNGEVAPAAGGHLLYEVDLTPGMSNIDVAIIIADAIGGRQDNTITAVAAASVTAGSYFTFNANSVIYYVWYKKNGAGAAPNTTTTTIEVDLIGSETAAQVASKTVIAINNTFFAVPDLRGVFLRGTDPTGIWDIVNASRNAYLGNMVGTNVGTYELSQLIAHVHPGSTVPFNLNPGFGLGAGTNGVDNNSPASLNISSYGGSENRPVNVYTTYFIRY